LMIFPLPLLVLLEDELGAWCAIRNKNDLINKI
jgi:hypothetical protein